ncbi:hypothetical protein OsI_35119 [Oryza sativa Indica Group]|uniref:Uncharacterized protein n=1 Tax=Oryza sativa subsp. indica TaxID=39946 RepID=A2ZBH1_ORYSI|nr:hypothetical protein OsI_35119 [Oryza sativa Indica Group]
MLQPSHELQSPVPALPFHLSSACGQMGRYREVATVTMDDSVPLTPLEGDITLETKGRRLEELELNPVRGVLDIISVS